MSVSGGNKRCELGSDRLPVLTTTREQTRAAITVAGAVRDSIEAGRTPPCVLDPASWDVDMAAGGSHRVARREVRQAVRMCLTRCPVLEQCRVYLATLVDHPATSGIVAGEYVHDQAASGTGALARQWVDQALAELAAEHDSGALPAGGAAA